MEWWSLPAWSSERMLHMVNQQRLLYRRPGEMQKPFEDATYSLAVRASNSGHPFPSHTDKHACMRLGSTLACLA